MFFGVGKAWANNPPSYWFGNTAGSNLATTGTNYLSIVGNQASNTTESNKSLLIPSAGVISNFYMYLGGTPGTGASYTFTIRHSTNGGSSYSAAGSPSNMSITISGSSTSGSDLSNTVAVAQGDLVDIQETESTSPAPTACHGYWAFTFTPTNVNETILPGYSWSQLSNSTKNYVSLTGTDSASGSNIGVIFDQQILIPSAGTIKNLYVNAASLRA